MHVKNLLNLFQLNTCLICRFLYSVTQTLGTVGSLAVSSIDVDTLPVLMIIMRSRSNTEIFTIVHGNVGVNELLTNLVQAVDVFQVRKYSFYFIQIYYWKSTTV